MAQEAGQVGVNRLLLVAVALVASVGIWLGYGYVQARREAPRVRVADLLVRPYSLEGKTVSLVLGYDKRSETDPVADLISRSDCYLHDETGSILLFGGWQVWIDWRDAQDYRSDWVDVDAAGQWHVKKAIVRYTPDGLPYLEPPGDAGN